MFSKITNDSDKELVVELKVGNKAAFKLLFKKYYRRLIEFCLYRTRDLELSKDLVQELFTKIWNVRDKIDPEKSFQAYLYKSLTNQIINHSKLASSKNISLDVSHFAKYANEEEPIENRIDIEYAIENLPIKLKTVFLLSRIEGFKYSEIAEICDISVKAVEKRMSKAFVLLRNSIK